MEKPVPLFYGAAALSAQGAPSLFALLYKSFFFSMLRKIFTE